MSEPQSLPHSPVTEYKIATGWAVFLYVAGTALIGLFVWVLTLSSRSGMSTAAAGVITVITAISVAMIVLMVLGMIEAWKGRVRVSEDKVEVTGVFSRRELKLDEIKGYLIDKDYIRLMPFDPKVKPLKISQYIGRKNELVWWIGECFVDLEGESEFEEEQEILADEKTGWRRDYREDRLKRARSVSRVINTAAWVAATWAVFYPVPYEGAMLTAMIVPMAALAAFKMFGGLIRADEKTGSAYPSVAYAFILPPCALVIRVMSDYEIFDYSNLWPVVLSATLILTLVLAAGLRRELNVKKAVDYLIFLILAALVFAYSFGAAVYINCFYDNSAPKRYAAQVEEKRESSGKSTSYYFTLSAWGEAAEPGELSVSKNLYERLDKGDTAYVYLRNGKLDVPWVEVWDE